MRTKEKCTLSYDENEIKKLIKESITDKNKAVSIFQMLGSQSRIRDDEVRKQQQLLKQVKLLLKEIKTL
jgi:hypothetical protein